MSSSSALRVLLDTGVWLHPKTVILKHMHPKVLKQMGPAFLLSQARNTLYFEWERWNGGQQPRFKGRPGRRPLEQSCFRHKKTSEAQRLAVCLGHTQGMLLVFGREQFPRRDKCATHRGEQFPNQASKKKNLVIYQLHNSIYQSAEFWKIEWDFHN